MKSKFAAVMFVAIVLAVAFAFVRAHVANSRAPETQYEKERAPQTIPPLPAGVTELKFDDFFVKPVGPRGLELTEKLKSVGILGFMVSRIIRCPPLSFSRHTQCKSTITMMRSRMIFHRPSFT